MPCVLRPLITPGSMYLFGTLMARPIPFKKLLEREIRKVIEAASALEPALRLDALKLGVDWQKAINKDSDASERGAFFAQSEDEADD